MSARLSAVGAALLLAACSDKPRPATPEPTAPPAAPAVVEITATDFAFQAPDTIRGGWITLRLRNNGKELHHGWLVRLSEGKTIADLAKLGPHEMPSWMTSVGGPSAPGPGGALETTVNLAAGHYAIVCVIPSPDHLPHLAKGMVKALVVTEGVASEPPAADITVRLSDYAFDFSAPLTAGKHTLRVEVAAGQPHELIIAKLAPGKKAEDFAAWVENMAEPPPVEGVIGGTAALGAGSVNVFQADVTPGNYAIVCFIPDAKDGAPHSAHGMIKTVTVM